MFLHWARQGQEEAFITLGFTPLLWNAGSLWSQSSDTHTSCNRHPLMGMTKGKGISKGGHAPIENIKIFLSFLKNCGFALQTQNILWNFSFGKSFYQLAQWKWYGTKVCHLPHPKKHLPLVLKKCMVGLIQTSTFLNKSLHIFVTYNSSVHQTEQSETQPIGLRRIKKGEPTVLYWPRSSH